MVSRDCLLEKWILITWRIEILACEMQGHKKTPLNFSGVQI
ncbi:hypothetical protein D1AOALGA4SA_1712 [Olavius algarvensis Delta 1 endosymbiont]|nr:hypothetical protein D1AOALGA4SA_1712 [Olavius algarvensis Delta 1 endosymbiont]